MKVSQLYTKAKQTVKKNSPLILTVTGVVGLVGTAYLAYKSAKEVEEVVEEIEDARKNNKPVDVQDVGKKLIKATYKPVLVGIASITCIIGSYRILNGRVLGLSAAFYALGEEFERYRGEVVNEVGHEIADKITAAANAPYMEPVGEDETKVEPRFHECLTGTWFERSEEWVSDDIDYNKAFVDAAIEKIQDSMFRKGVLLLNEVYDVLGIQRSQAGAVLGWKVSFNIEQFTANFENEDGEWEPSIYIKWDRPVPVYDDVEFEGRYAAFKL